jgi:hypothetical protein
MNHSKTTTAIAAIVIAVALTGVALAVPQQALAGGHRQNNHSNSIKVDQQINQLNNCTSQQTPSGDDQKNRDQPSSSSGDNNPDNQPSVSSSTVCLNLGENSANIHK